MTHQPYTYLLHHIPTDTWYYGVRWAKGCHTSELWIKYFTSSKRVAQLRKQYGNDSFTYEIRRTFKFGKAASNWETKVLRRIKVLEQPNIWLNKTTNTAWLYDVHPRGMAGKHQTDMGLKALLKGHGWNAGLTGIYDEETKHAIGSAMRGKEPWNKGKTGLQKHTEEWKRQKSLSMMGNHYRQ